MGNCANKPLTAEEGEAAPVEKPEEVMPDRGMVVDENKVTADTAADDQSKPRSLAQVLEEEGKKAEATEAAKPAEGKPSEPAKVETEAKKEEVTEPKKEEPKPASSDPKKDETKPAPTPAEPAVKKPVEPADPKVDDKKPESK